MIDLLKYPMTLPPYGQLWLLLPLLAAVAVVYKTVRAEDVRRIWLESLLLFAYMLGGLVVLGAILWAVISFWP
ncbi:MAG: hypothetical protein GXY38_04305 [Planctomycetes bacterium]|jgi:hypothetical protein|nr:hypothetical protein [Planctomycetota bacterium]